MFLNIILNFLNEPSYYYTVCSPGGAVPQGRLDHDAAGGHPLQSARSRQGMVQYPRDKLGGLPDLKDEEDHGDGEV